MPKYTRLQQALISAEADMQVAIRQADLARQKYLLLRQKETMAEERRLALVKSKRGNHDYHRK